MLLEYLGSSGGCQSACNSPTASSTAKFGCENSEKRSSLLSILPRNREGLYSLSLLPVAGLEAYVTSAATNFYHVFSSSSDGLNMLQILAVASFWGTLGAVVVVWIEKQLSYSLGKSSAIIGSKRLSDTADRVTPGLKQPVYYLSTEAQQVEGLAEPVVVNLEKSYGCTSSEAERHDFEVELAIAKGLSKPDVAENLFSLDKKIKEASALFAQIEETVVSEAKILLRSRKPSNTDVIHFIKELFNTYRLSVEAYTLLLEVVEIFWDYSLPQIQEEFRDKAQKILDQKAQKIHVAKELPQEIDIVFDGLNIKLSIENEENLEQQSLTDTDKEAIRVVVRDAFEFYNDYVDISEKFAESVLAKAEDGYSFQRDESLKLAKESFCQGWYEAITGQTIPLSELWDGVEFEE